MDDSPRVVGRGVSANIEDEVAPAEVDTRAARLQSYTVYSTFLTQYVPCTVLRIILLTPPVHCICIRHRSYGSHDISMFAHLSKYR